MIGSFLRNAKKGLRRLLNVKKVRLDGVLLSTDLAHVSWRVRNEVFKGTYEQPEAQLVREYVQRGDRVLEIGGGVGFVSLLCAQICGAENVLTYEANSLMASTIEFNYALNELKPNLRSKAVTAHGREVTFFVNENIISSSVHARSGGVAQTVNAEPLEEIISDWKPTTIVMDVEGAETNLLRASKLDGVKKLIIEWHPHIVGADEIAELKLHLAGLGFREAREIYKSACFVRA
jgi:FkbM family methyltransferase